MKKALLTFAAVLIIILISGVVFGYMGGHGTHRNFKHMGMKGSGMMKAHGMMGYGMIHGNLGCQKMMNFMKDAEFYLSYEDELGLSESQVKALKSISDDHQKDALKKHAEIKSLMKDFEKILSEDEIVLSEANSLNKKIAVLRAELWFENLEAAVKAKEILNDEQLDKFESYEKDCCYGRGKHGCYKMH